MGGDLWVLRAQAQTKDGAALLLTDTGSQTRCEKKCSKLGRTLSLPSAGEQGAVGRQISQQIFHRLPASGAKGRLDWNFTTLVRDSLVDRAALETAPVQCCDRGRTTL
jgi:hypothetical protein